MFLDKVISDFKPHKMGLSKVLGDLESEIMEIVWGQEKVTVRDVYETLRQKREIAYTTVMTIMSRLAEKNLLAKEPLGNAFLYAPTISRNDFMSKVVHEVLDGLFEDFAEPAISQFVEKLTNADEDKISQLETLIKERREQGAK